MADQNRTTKGDTGNSRLSGATTAIRPPLRARILLAGASGAGKTRSSLVIAETLRSGPEASRVLVIDTEEESALTYADDFEFEHIPWSAPYDPRDLGATIREAGDRYEVIIVDSFTHFWRGEGGTLDIANGKFTGWKEARPAHEETVQAMLRANCHIILCARAKTQYEQREKVSGSGFEVVKLGVGPVQDSELEYEVNVALMLDVDHEMTVTKSRSTAVPTGRAYRPGRVADFAREYADWLTGGAERADAAAIEVWRVAIDSLPDGAKGAAKAEFLTRFGRPDNVPADLVGDADALVSTHLVAAGLDAIGGTPQQVQETPAAAGGGNVTPDAPGPQAATEDDGQLDVSDAG